MDDTSKPVKDFLKIGIQEAFLSSEYLLKYVENGPERARHLANMEGLVKNYCLLDHTLQVRPNIIRNLEHEEDTRRAQDENPDVNNAIPDFAKKISDKVVNAMKKVNVEDHVKMKDFKKKVTRLQHIADGTSGDDELMVTDESDNFIDPISKRELVDPVISTRCQHKFSRKSITQHLLGKDYSMCPYVGCREKLTMGEFEEDVITAHTLKRMQLQRQA